MVMTKKSNGESRSKFQKNNRSSDCSLQLENMKEESLVISNQQVEVNRVMDFVHTARHAMEISSMRS